MAKALNVEELIKELQKLNPKSYPVFCDAGPGHYYYFIKSEIGEEVHPYFPGDIPTNIKYDDDGETNAVFVEIGTT